MLNGSSDDQIYCSRVGRYRPFSSQISPDQPISRGATPARAQLRRKLTGEPPTCNSSAAQLGRSQPRRREAFLRCKCAMFHPRRATGVCRTRLPLSKCTSRKPSRFRTVLPKPMHRICLLSHPICEQSTRKVPLTVTSYKMISTRLHLVKACIWMRYPIAPDDINATV